MGNKIKKMKIVAIIVATIFSIFFAYIKCIERRSISSFIIEKYFWVSGTKKYFEAKSEEEVEKILKDAQKISDMEIEIPKLGVKVERKHYLNSSYLLINENENKKVILYIHGGSYINQPNSYHYKFLEKIAKQTNYTILVPIYPKAPRYNYMDTLESIKLFYTNLQQSYNNIILMGDSAGGSIALSLLKLVKDNGMKLPKKTILISPVVDLSFDNEKIEEYEKKDPYLSKFLLKKIGELWSKNDTKNPLVSPIYNTFNDVNKIIIITGTHDILYPDIEKFIKKLKAENVEHQFIIKEKMNHDYPLYPIPEAKQAQKLIIEEL